MRLYEKLTVTNLRRAYMQGKLAPGDVMRECIRRAHGDQNMNVWIHLLTEEEMEPYLKDLSKKNIEDCPLWGIPFAVKDNIDLKGIPTTAGCPGYAYLPEMSAEVVQRVVDAGAIPIGKTNMDQFATGLVGTRSPYGETHNGLLEELISGGSSSGSAVAVFRGHAAFSFGTDTAGSGRVPAALHGLYGWKPSRGAYPVSGVVPACESLDCVSVFANSMEDAVSVDRCVRGMSTADPWSRELPFPEKKTPKHLFVANLDRDDFYGPFAQKYFEAWTRTVDRLRLTGIPMTFQDSEMFRKAASILYGGPLVAERWAALGDFVQEHEQEVFPVTMEVLKSGAGDKYSASELFQAQHLLQWYQLKTRELLKDAIYITPTCGGTWTREQVRTNPIDTNTDMGRYTNHCNLLDLCAAAIPADMADDRLPFGITAFALCGAENLLAGFEERWRSCMERMIPLAVFGLHMRGMACESQLTKIGGIFDRKIHTAPCYRMVLVEGEVKKPGLIYAGADGESIEGELWLIPETKLGGFVDCIRQPLGFGKIVLEDETEVEGFVYTGGNPSYQKDITAFKNFKKYMESYS